MEPTLSLQDLQAMGAQPVAPTAGTAGGGGGGGGGLPVPSNPVAPTNLSLPELKAMGSQPIPTNPAGPLGNTTYGQNVIANQQSGVDQVKAGIDQIGKGLDQAKNAPAKSFGDVVWNTAKGAGNIFSGSFNTAMGAVNTAFAPISAAVQTSGQLPVPGTGKNVGDFANEGVKAAGDFFGSSPELQKVTQFYPNIVQDLGNAIGLAQLFLVPEGKKTVSNTVSSLTDKLNTIPPGGSPPPGSGSISDFINNQRAKVAQGNVPDNFGTSVDRLANAPSSPEIPPTSNTDVSVDNLTHPPAGTSISEIKNPLQIYDEYYNQELKFKNDIHEDMAISKLGTDELNPAIDQVIKTKKEAGAIMGSEMARIGDTPVNISNAFPSLETQLNDNGLTYDSNENGLVSSRVSKVSLQDKGLLNTYVNDLNTLGANPTAQELDAFLSRIQSELKVYKNSNNITGVTNGERIINSNLSQLRDQLSPSVNPVFEKYYKAKSDYAALSNFLDQGSSFVGEKTASGDFAKDASLMKSAVQSLLNGGKKDWLIKLENLTKKNILDKAVLALQAAKDAGNYRAQSLLDILTPKGIGEIPTTPHGAIMKAVDKGLEYAKEKFSGTPYEQTRRIIENRMKGGDTQSPSYFPRNVNEAPNINNPSQTTPINIPKGGQSTESINNNNNSSIDNIVPQTDKPVKQGIVAKDTTPQVVVDNHIAEINGLSAQDIKDEGGIKVLRDQIKGDIVKALTGEGYIDEAGTISKMDFTKYKTVKSMTKALSVILK